ncbi:transcriptional regulator [Candidatus Marinamargulisbacteria bacterium SCGC AG-343-D04]|nr:transcriptional regulator [Candidatus Marinamargulisbacteria bacterium SCGC AG-343-D04]
MKHKNECPVTYCIRCIGGKWKPLILWHINQCDVLRYGELFKTIPKITQKMLTQQLRSLEEDGIVSRKVYPIIPPKVEYSLTKHGKSVIPVLESMAKWGQHNYI